jgi:hypothetical protein
MFKRFYLLGIIILVIVIPLILLPAFGQSYYPIGNGDIYDIELDAVPGQLIIPSGESLYIVRMSDINILDEFEIPGITTNDLEYGITESDHIYLVGAGNDGWVEGSLDRNTNEINNYNIDVNYIPTVQLQDDYKLYAICQDQSPGPGSMGGKIFVFNKDDLSLENVWPCEMWPELALYDYENQKIIIAQGYTTSYSESVYSPWEEGVQWLSNVGIYDPSRSGELIQEYTVQGSIAGLTQASDGTIIVGLAGDKENWVHASTLAVLSDPIRYVDIENYQVACMDYDTANDRVIASVSIDDSEIGISILVWYYNTEEYEIIESDVQPMLILKYYDGKVYTSTGKDNRLYVIDIGCPPLLPPVADFSCYPGSGPSPLTVTIENNSYDEDGYIVRIECDWNADQQIDEVLDGNPSVFNHTFTEPGYNNFILTVVDNDNLTASWVGVVYVE